MDDYLRTANQIADSAAEIALTYFSFETENTWKEDGSPLTVADTKINKLVIDTINTAFPEHSILGEEESDRKKGSRYIWVCDPVDGTVPFSVGLPTFTFSLALVDQSDGQPIMGLVNDPVMKNRYWATKGGGAYRNGIKIHVALNTDLKNTYVEIDGSSIFNRMDFSNTKTMEDLRSKGSRAMKLLSVVYGGIQVANGKFVGVIFFGPYAHDVAALKIITEEAGGRATDLAGASRRYDEQGLGFLASNGILHQELLSAIAKA